MFNAPKDIGLILTAAGRSSRMGFPKGLIEIVGSKLYRLHCQNFSASFPLAPILLILGHHQKEYLEDLARDPLPHLTTFINERYDWGQFSSIHFAIKQALDMGLEQVLLHPVDLPPLQPELYSTLLLHARHHWVAKPCCAGRSGHPIYLRKEAMELIVQSDPQNGRLDHLLRSIDKTRIHWWECDCPEINLNLNTPEVLSQFLDSWRQK